MVTFQSKLSGVFISPWSSSYLLHSDSLVVKRGFTQPQIWCCCRWTPCPLVVLLTFSQDRCFRLGLADLRLSSRAGRIAELSSVAPPALAQHKVIVGRCAHGIKYIGFARDLELWGRKRNEVMKHYLFAIAIYFPSAYFCFISHISQAYRESHFWKCAFSLNNSISEDSKKQVFQLKLLSCLAADLDYSLL